MGNRSFVNCYYKNHIISRRQNEREDKLISDHNPTALTCAFSRGHSRIIAHKMQFEILENQMWTVKIFMHFKLNNISAKTIPSELVRESYYIKIPPTVCDQFSVSEGFSSLWVMNYQSIRMHFICTVHNRSRNGKLGNVHLFKCVITLFAIFINKVV